VLNSRAKRLGATLAERGIDAVLITDLANIRYLTGFTGSSARLLLTAKAGYLLTDSRYKIQAAAELKGKQGLKLRICKTAYEELGNIIKKANIKKLGFESASVSYDAYLALKKAFKGVSFKSVSTLVEGERVVKDSSELRVIRKAIAVADKGFKGVERALVSTKTEVELASYIEAIVKRSGAEAMSFDTIVASGKRSALPHAKPTGNMIKKRGFLTVDMGVSLGGYKSDETRTYVVGEPTRRQREVYGVVKEAHDKAIDVVKAGALASDVDAGARRVIKKAGYGKYFGHGTGHGVGINVHERPGLGPKSKDVLKEGMVITIEPGIYIPGWGGVRIEDMVLVTGRGCEVLTDGSQELRILR
jgi:Xaa-Pro aminopeptidase